MASPKRFVVVSDNHGDMQDARSVEGLFAFVADFKPQIRIHAGDNWDFRNLRRGASDDEKAGSLAEDWEIGEAFLRQFFDGGETKVFLRGNHDERLWHFANTSVGIIRDYARDGIRRVERIVRSQHARMLPYDAALGVYPLGKLNVLHGYHAGASACRQHAAIYGNCLFGHVHTMESAPVPSLEPAEARSNACLCIRDMDYINARTGKLKWAQGWHYGFLYDDGHYTLFPARKIDNRFVAACDVKEF